MDTNKLAARLGAVLAEMLELHLAHHNNPIHVEARASLRALASSVERGS